MRGNHDLATLGALKQTLVPSPERGVRLVSKWLLFNGDTVEATFTVTREDHRAQKSYTLQVVTLGVNEFGGDTDWTLLPHQSLAVVLAAAHTTTAPTASAEWSDQ